MQIMSQELMATMQRLPSWQDMQYLLDPTFVKNTTAGFHLAHPGFVLAFLLVTAVAVVLPVRRLGWGKIIASLVTGCLLLGLHSPVNRALSDQSVAARYNALHWMVTDASARQFSDKVAGLSAADLPQNLRIVDLGGAKLLPEETGGAKNVLLVILEGIPGIYFPEIREEMGVTGQMFQMDKLAASTSGGMLVADFVAHSHQTIRGLYALHCGDFSKFSYEMPKAMELQDNPDRAAECLPAQMSMRGWQSHYLQGAGLQFMNKERAMPIMGFEHVHGVEWFTERTENDFIWGTSDADFFTGARKYIGNLQAAEKPWLLSLLTVATHQPFAATDAQAEKYAGSRKIATVALLDEAVAAFIDGLRRDRVLDDTLVIITSDESHGEEGADWYSSWGFAIVLAPEQEKLPRMKKGTYGLVDIEASVLDYFNLPMPPSIIGRSIFRDYSTGRDMVSYTSSKLRWQTAENSLFECGRDGNCRKIKGGLIGLRPEVFEEDTENSAGRFFGLATVLDHKLSSQKEKLVLQFAGGEIRKLPEKVKNEWTDNLIGAQYLDFPAKSTVHVDIRLKAMTVQHEGVQLKLTLRQFEKEVTTIDYPPFPLLHSGEESHIEFAFNNTEARQAFSFHLVGEGRDSTIQFEKFAVTIQR